MSDFRIKLWSGIGHFTWAGLSLAAPIVTEAATSDEADPAAGAESTLFTQPGMMLAQGGEGGEREVPGSYRLLSRDPQAYAFDVRVQAQGYAELVYQSYRKAHADARTLQASIKGLLAKPTAASLANARKAWVEARPAYLMTEAFRFYDGPIDLDPSNGEPGPEPHINAWPLNEAFIDYVKDQPKAGIVNDPSVPLTAESIRKRDQVTDESDVTTGWHAIEFLLWGQDFNPDGPGQRPHTDYLATKTNERRRTYLSTVTAMLVDDLAGLEAAWQPEADNYRRRFLALEPREALGRIINGAANLVGHELSSERLSVALDSGDQEDEHSCFSDTTHQDHIFDLQGVRNVWLGSRDGKPAPDGLRALMLRIDPYLARETDALFAIAQSAADNMDQPFETILRAPPGSPPRQRAEAAVTAFKNLGAGLVNVGRRIGVLVIVPGLGGG
jgi:putative iron-regulated protein